MTGHVRKRGNSWCVVVPIGSYPNSRTKYKWHGGYRTKAEAEKAKARIVDQLNQGSYVAPRNVTVAEYLREWVSKRSIRSRTESSYRLIIERHLVPRLGHLELTKLRPQDLRDYYDWALKRGRLDGAGKPTGKPLSAGTVHGHHRVLHKALADAVKLEFVGRNVAEAVDPPRRPKSPARVWTREETQRFLEAATASRYYALYALAATTGLREGELLGLHWSDVDLGRGVLTVRQELVKAGRSPVFEPVKSDNSRRAVTLPESATALLREHRARQAEERLRCGPEWRGLDLVFTGEFGVAVHAQNLRSRDFRPLMERAGVLRIRFHDLRHTHASHLLQAGIHPKEVQGRFGHSQIGITMDLYSHLAPGYQDAAAASVDDLLPAQKPDSKRGFAPDLQRRRARP